MKNGNNDKMVEMITFGFGDFKARVAMVSGIVKMEYGSVRGMIEGVPFSAILRVQ